MVCVSPPEKKWYHGDSFWDLGCDIQTPKVSPGGSWTILFGCGRPYQCPTTFDLSRGGRVVLAGGLEGSTVHSRCGCATQVQQCSLCQQKTNFSKLLKKSWGGLSSEVSQVKLPLMVSRYMGCRSYSGPDVIVGSTQGLQGMTQVILPEAYFSFCFKARQSSGPKLSQNCGDAHTDLSQCILMW